MSAKGYDEFDAICRAIIPFFTSDMWTAFCMKGPNGNDYTAWLDYLRAEWLRIAIEFESVFPTSETS